MSNSGSLLAGALGLALCVGVNVAAFASAPASGDGPVLVVAAPWGGGPTQVVRRAGGRVLGPSKAPFSAMAADASPAAFVAAGAWIVLDGSALGFLCADKGPS